MQTELGYAVGEEPSSQSAVRIQEEAGTWRPEREQPCPEEQGPTLSPPSVLSEALGTKSQHQQRGEAAVFVEQSPLFSFDLLLRVT